jgi:UDP-N-acetylmuramyl pentapeptide phosphotransferase/UDP-N-acetylglucosamine-1-phosphate transferase
MSGWAFWLVVILLAVLLIIGALFALREFRKNKKLGSAIVHYILLVVLAIIVLKLLFAVSALAVPF